MEKAKSTLSTIDQTPVAHPSSNAIVSVPGPKATATASASAGNNALSGIEREIRAAIADFTQATGTHLEAFSAMLYAFKQNGLNTRRMGEAALQP